MSEGVEATIQEELSPQERIDKVLESLKETRARTDRIANEPHPFSQEEDSQPTEK